MKIKKPWVDDAHSKLKLKVHFLSQVDRRFYVEISYCQLLDSKNDVALGRNLQLAPHCLHVDSYNCCKMCQRTENILTFQQHNDNYYLTMCKVNIVPIESQRQFQTSKRTHVHLYLQTMIQVCGQFCEKPNNVHSQ